MFKYQAMIYRSYHMQDVRVFYNQEDLWAIPNEIYRDRPQLMEPYYIVVKLPGEEREEFMLMVPFTPARKDNMIGWLAARCDADNYGDLLVYRLPKDRMIFGPMQLEARIDQQPEISSQLTLWGQKGSEVIRGNMLAIPDRAVVPVRRAGVPPGQPAAAESPASRNRGHPSDWDGPRRPRRPSYRSTAIPELKQVIVAFGGRVVMRGSFEEALAEIFGMVEEPADGGAEERVAESRALRRGASRTRHRCRPRRGWYRRRKPAIAAPRKALREWDWTRAGEELEALEDKLEELGRELEHQP